MRKRKDPRSSAEDSPVRTSLEQASSEASMDRSLDSGASSPESFAHYDLQSSSWKASPLSPGADSTGYSETWPNAGTMRSGVVSERPTLERPISGADSSSSPYKAPYPTPTNARYGSSGNGQGNNI